MLGPVQDVKKEKIKLKKIKFDNFWIGSKELHSQLQSNHL
jgi:hypothetical protein